MESIIQIRLEKRLWEMEDESQKAWWDAWLCQFMKNFKNRNKPKKPSDGEILCLLDCLTKMKSIYPEAVDILCEGYIPNNIDSFEFWIDLSNNEYACKW